MQKKLGFVLAALIAVAGAGAVAAVFPNASNQGYYPEQPIPFSHKLHAGKNKINCQYCHTAADKSRHATVPAMNVCMNCHSQVKRVEGADKDSEWIAKLTDAYNKKQPIEWVRIHELPDYVYFPHKTHVKKGVACETCHGDVSSVERVEQYAPLTMGWCLDCHRGDSTPDHILNSVYPDVKNPRGMQVAPQNCTTCHY